MKKFDATVLVATYYPDSQKLKATLRSILEQTGVKLEIVIADDGSKEIDFSYVEDFFSKYRFCDYTIVNNKENKGTVINIISGLRASSSEYVKLLSPGDLLYDERTMERWLEFIRKSNADITFSTAVFYFMKGTDDFSLIKHKHNPTNIRAFIKPLPSIDRVINYLLIEDGISGATLLLKRAVLEKYLILLKNRVIYAEDFFLKLAILENASIKCFFNPGIWYEYGDGGVSTTPSKLWRERLRRDAYNMGQICLENYKGNDSRIIECIKEYIHNSYGGKKSRWDWLCKLLRHPRWLYWYLHRRFFSSNAPLPKDDRFLRHCFTDM